RPLSAGARSGDGTGAAGGGLRSLVCPRGCDRRYRVRAAGCRKPGRAAGCGPLRHQWHDQPAGLAACGAGGRAVVAVEHGLGHLRLLPADRPPCPAAANLSALPRPGLGRPVLVLPACLLPHRRHRRCPAGGRASRLFSAGSAPPPPPRPPPRPPPPLPPPHPTRPP